jgi:DNA-binding MarR family transcriptional regulator
LYTAWWLKTVFAIEFKKYGLTAEQFNVMRILKGKHPEKMCVRDITSRMIEKNSNVPRIIDRLEIKKMVKRSVSPQDKRETSISITEVGINILEIVSAVMKTSTQKTIKISEQDAADLNNYLESMRGDSEF